MLETLRKGATTKIAAVVIFAPLIVAFALWGIAPEIRNTGTNVLARVGKTDISPDEFQQAYQIELQNLSAQFGRRITPDQGRAFGLDQRVLSRLIGSAAIDQQARNLGLTVADRDMIEQISKDPNFAGLDGRFSRDAFNQFLRGIGLSEQGYLNVRRKDEVRQQLLSIMEDGAPVPRTIIDTLHRHNGETRALAFFTMDADKVVKVADPSDATLKTYFEANKRAFMTPAFRKFNLLTLSREIAKSKLDISEADIKAAYEATKDSFDTPEKRKLQQVSFPDKASAEKAYATLAKATDFVAEAAKLGFKETDIDLGEVTKAQMIDKAIADVAFSTAKGAVSKPIEGQFTTALIRVVDVTPGTTKTFEEVKPLVKDRLATERAGREIVALFDKAEDERNAGRTFKEIADKTGLTLATFEAVDRNGNGADGKPVAGIPDTAKVLAAVFAGSQGVEADAVELADGYAWFEILGVTPEKERAFDEVKDAVKARWIAIEKTKALGEAAAKFVERLIKGEDIAKVAADAGGDVQTVPKLTRTGPPPTLTNDALRQVFALPKGSASSAASPDGKSRVVFRVTDVMPAPEPSKDELDRLKAEVQRGLQTDALNVYVGALQTRLGVNINQQVLNQTLGVQSR